MAISQIGLNFSKLNNMTTPVFNFTTQTKSEFIDSIPASANSLTNHYFGLIILLVISIFLFWVLTEKVNYGFFRYSEIRGLGITFALVSIIGIKMIMIGYITNVIHLGYFVGLYMLMLIYTLFKNPD